jgi:hypothetical protein
MAPEVFLVTQTRELVIVAETQKDALDASRYLFANEQLPLRAAAYAAKNIRITRVEAEKM